MAARAFCQAAVTVSACPWGREIPVISASAEAPTRQK